MLLYEQLLCVNFIGELMDDLEKKYNGLNAKEDTNCDAFKELMASNTSDTAAATRYRIIETDVNIEERDVVDHATVTAAAVEAQVTDTQRRCAVNDTPGKTIDSRCDNASNNADIRRSYVNNNANETAEIKSDKSDKYDTKTESIKPLPMNHRKRSLLFDFGDQSPPPLMPVNAAKIFNDPPLPVFPPMKRYLSQQPPSPVLNDDIMTPPSPPKLFSNLFHDRIMNSNPTTSTNTDESTTGVLTKHYFPVISGKSTTTTKESAARTILALPKDKHYFPAFSRGLDIKTEVGSAYVHPGDNESHVMNTTVAKIKLCDTDKTINAPETDEGSLATENHVGKLSSLLLTNQNLTATATATVFSSSSSKSVHHRINHSHQPISISGNHLFANGSAELSHANHVPASRVNGAGEFNHVTKSSDPLLASNGSGMFSPTSQVAEPRDPAITSNGCREFNHVNHVNHIDHVKHESTSDNLNSPTESEKSSDRNSRSSISSNSASAEDSLSSCLPTSGHPTTSNIFCVVCGDKSSGKHYGQFTCEGCKSFFKRTVRRSLTYACRNKKNCPIDQHHRNQCQACRYKKCVSMGMRKDAVQRGRSSHPQGGYSLLPNELGVGGPASIVSGTSSGFGICNVISMLLRAESLSRYTQLTTIGLENIRETACRLLISTVQFARSTAPFPELHLSDQVMLLRSSWTELFTISAAQYSIPEHLLPLLAAAFVHTTASGGAGGPPTMVTENLGEFMERVRYFQDQIQRLKKLNMDSIECGCLKAIALFNSDVSGIHDRAHIEACQDRVQCALEDYTKSHYPAQPFKFGKLLLRLPPLHRVNSSIIEQLFFARLTGKSSVDDLLRDMILGGGNLNSAWCITPPPSAVFPTAAGNAGAAAAALSFLIPTVGNQLHA